MKTLLFTLAMVCMLLFTPAWVVGEEEEGGIEENEQNREEIIEQGRIKYIYTPVFKNTVSFFAIVTVSGTAETLGLSQKGLTDFAKLKIKNNISDIPMWNRSYSPAVIESKVMESDRDLYPCHWLIIEVWTVGDDYPVAFHISMNCGPPHDLQLYQGAMLGYGSKYSIEEQVKKSIKELVENFAITFYKARGEI